jgi:hypothetical protein
MRLSARGKILRLGRVLAQGKTLANPANGFFRSFAHKKADFHPPDDLQKINP